MKYLLARAVEKVRLRLKLEDLDGDAWPSAAKAEIGLAVLTARL
jgi:hypothetical protein